MKLFLLNQAVCRTPAFDMSAELNEHWEELKNKISESSPTFYQTIKHLNAQNLSSLPLKTQFTIWKYFTRAKLRATPFGSFSAVTLLPVSNQCPQLIQLANKMNAIQFKDWTEKELAFIENEHFNDASVMIIRNSTIYNVKDHARFIRFREGKFEIANVISFPQMNAILKYCKIQKSYSELYHLLKAEFGMSRFSSNRLLQDMISLQMLIKSTSPNITGEDYFERTKQTKSTTNLDYLIAKRKLLKGELSSQSLRHIPNLLNFLAVHLPEQENGDLVDFKRSFRQKFEGMEVPLPFVLDPETGIGYGKLEQLVNNDSLNILKQEAPDAIFRASIEYTNLHSFILDQLMAGSQKICLENFESLPTPIKEHLPNTFSVILHFFNDQPVIQSVGGSSANILLGRFTMAGKDFESYAREIAAIEEKANPDVLFFDIAYQAEKKVDNVNRRKNLYANELPILTWSCLPDPLELADILVSIVENTVVLRSKKHNRRLVPRIPSAYDYSRSDLAAYRFLCDIQNQQLKTDLNFNLRNFFPNLQYYPQINFREIIVAPQMWRIPPELTGYRKKDNSPITITQLSRWLASKGIKFTFKIGETDTTLCFDPKSNTDLQALVMFCKNYTHEYLYVREALIGKQSNVTDETGNNYAGQFIINYAHNQEIYPKIPQLQNQDWLQNRTAIYLPGTEWLYFEIYSYPTMVNLLLIEIICKLLRENKCYFKKWFFIRYNEPSSHLRLRIQLKNTIFSHMITQSFNALLAPFMSSGQVSQMLIKAYEPEIYRYGEKRMEKVEIFFHADSKYALKIIEKTKNEEELYAIVICTVDILFLEHWLTLNEKLIFVKQMADTFAKENLLIPFQFSQLNQSYNQLKSSIENQRQFVNSLLGTSIHKTLANAICGAGKQKERLLADLIHMHINRVFASDQRLHETIVYHYLLRHLQAFYKRPKPLVEQ